MAIVAKVFVSAVTRELGSYRKAAATQLARQGIHPVVQDTFPTDYREIERILRDKIEGCDAIVCLIGSASGFEPAGQPPDQPRRSYTQMEYDIALASDKPVYVFFARGRALSRSVVEDDEKARLQEEHRKALMASDRKWDTFNTTNELQKKLAEIQFPMPLEGVAPADRVRTAGLPQPGNHEVFVGRDGFLSALEGARADQTSRVVLLHGFGGIGKTTILWNWVERLRRQQFQVLPQILGYSFYNQGAQTGGKVSSRPFFDEARHHFRQLGCRTLDAVNPDRLGEEVARAFRRVGGLMVLDGLEPLQFAPNVNGGRCQDQELHDFLQHLGSHEADPDDRHWLLVMSSRYPMPPVGRHFRSIPVTTLTDADGGRLIRSLPTEEGRTLHFDPPAGCDPAQVEAAAVAEAEAASRDFGGQPLALVLLVTYLQEHHGGKLAMWKTVPAAEVSDEEMFGREHRHARRVMDAYHALFQSQDEPAPRRVLGLVSLFDRPAPRRLLEVLRGGSPITGLTDGLSERGYLAAVRRLRMLHLLLPGDDDALDAHPLIRARFSALLKAEHPTAWQEGQRRLFEELREPRSGEGDTERFDRCSQVIAHGSRAGLYAEASSYYFQVLTGSQDGRDSWKQLASMGDDLALLSHFFQVPWYIPSKMVPLPDGGEIMNEAGFDLFKLCRFSEAERAFERAVAAWRELREWRKASRDSVLLGKARAALGKLDAARDAAQHAMEFTDRLLRDQQERGQPISKMARKECMSALFFRGEVHHHRGEWEAAQVAFNLAVGLEGVYAEEFQDGAIYALRVFQYANFQFDRDQHEQSFQRLTRAQQICEGAPAGREQDMAYNRFLLARIHTARGEFDTARVLLNQALADCWRLAMIDGRIIVHLALAELAWALNDAAECDRHLCRAEQLCVPDDVRRYRAECLLARARYHVWRGEAEVGRPVFDEAAELVWRMGYRRRAGELRRLASEQGWPLPQGFPLDPV